MNSKFLITNLIDSAQITGSPAFNTSYPARYMKLLSRSKSARSVSAGDQAILVNWAGADQLIDSVIVAGHNITEWGTIRCRLFSGLNQDGTTVYDSGVLAATASRSVGDAMGWNDSQFWLDSTVTAKSMQIDISDDYSIDGYIAIRRLYAGVALSPQVNISKGASLDISDNTTYQRAQSGTLYSQHKATFRGVNVDFSYLPDSEAIVWIAELLKAAKKSDFYISLFPHSVTTTKRYSHSFVAKLQSDTAFVCAYPGAKTMQLDLVEA